MRHELRLLLIALQFLTRIPVPAWVGWQPQWLHDCARHFPAIGLVVGGFGAAVLWAALWLWPPAIAVWVSIAATVWLTGAFHEDGLADTFDGLGGAVSRQRALEIMKDSRLGSYGAIGLLIVVVAKASALQVIAARQELAALIALPLAHAWSRAATVAMLWRLPYGGDAEHAKAKPLAQQVGTAGLAVALAWALLAGAAALVLWPPGRHGAAWPLAWAALAVGIVLVSMTRWLRRRLGGYTGDTLGATQQLCELSVVLALAAMV